MQENKIKVLVIGLTPPEQGGSQRRIYEISKRINVDVLTQKNSICKRKIELPVWKKSVFLRNISFSIFCFFYCFKLLFEKKYKIIHIHENLLYFLTPLLKLKYKVIITVHGLEGFKFYENKFLWYFFRIPLKFADIIIAVSKEDKKILNKEFKKIKYIPNGVDISLYKKRIKPKEKITFIGRIHEQKGIVYLLRAFEKIKDKIPNFKLEIIGKGEKNYENILKRKFKDKRIIWKGFILNSGEIARNLESSYLICLPSLWEGLPLTLFEALASGRPVIASNLPVFRTIVKHKNQIFFVNSTNSKELSHALLFLIQNKKLAEKLGREGRKIAEKYDWKKLLKKLEEIYESLK